MLLALEIKNFALINQLHLQFEKGLNILTGETGAGKSIIIDAVNMVIGDRADRQMVRSGCTKCSIQAIFSGEDNEDLKQLFIENGIDWEVDNTIIIAREIYTNGRSISRVNGLLVTQSIIKTITEKLIDIHGQHQHQSLLNPHAHLDMLDAFGGDIIPPIRSKIEENYKKLIEYEGRLKLLCGNEMERERKIDLLRFQIEEIDTASLKEGEEEELIIQRDLVANSERIYSITAEAYENLYLGGQCPSILDTLSKLVTRLQGVEVLHPQLSRFYKELEDIQYRIQDISREIRDYKDHFEFDPLVLNEIEKRLDIINSLKRKYGKSISEVLEYRKTINNELEALINSEEEIEAIKGKLKVLKLQLEEDSLKLTEVRKKIATKLEEELIGTMKELNMGRGNFVVDIKPLVDANGSIKVTAKGVDQVEFMMSANLGEGVKPLSKIASGGEMSRIMLAIKTILADVDRINTLIFDEIDSGISGNTANIVGEKLQRISKNHQVICITHLPQIAARANNHYLIEKIENKENTVTVVNKLNQKERINEIGRLLGGDLTEITLKHAEEMINKI